MPARWLPPISLLVVGAVALSLSGCAFGPKQSESQQVERRSFDHDGARPASGLPPAAPAPSAAVVSTAFVEGPAEQVPSPKSDTSKDESADRPSEPARPADEKAPKTELAADKAETKKYLNFEMQGRIQADAIFVSQTPKDKAIVGDYQNVVGFRRARLGAKGDVGEQIHWVSEFDFAGGSIAFKDVYIAADQLPIVRQLRVGNFPEPFSLEGATSSNVFPFCERSPIMALDPARHWGVGFFSFTENERLTCQGGAFRSGSGNDGNDIGDGNDMAYTLRVTGLPYYDCDENSYRLIHIGGAVSQTFLKNDVFTLNQGPQTSLLKPVDNPLSPFQPNLSLNASQYQLFNVQTATVCGPLSLQAEWTAADVDQVAGGPVFLNGCYVFGSWFVTGEHRQYSTKDGAFGMTQVHRPFVRMAGSHNLCCGPGAWELTARFAYSNFENSNIPVPANGLKQGNRLAETTVGVNWYLNDYARIMFNYVNAVPVDPNFGPSGANAFFIQSAVFW
ncbi:MAG: OprO/OprP family phosphate-selective porin [Gemmataceae bacterium]